MSAMSEISLRLRRAPPPAGKLHGLEAGSERNQRSKVSRLRQGCGEPRRTEDGVQRTDVIASLCTVNDRPRRSSTKADQLSTINNQPSTGLRVSLLTGGDDKPYVLGLAEAFTSTGVIFDVIGSDDLSLPELLNNHLINFLNLRGDQCPKVSLPRKTARVLRYYWRLIRYAASARPEIFHILWNNKFEFFDRTLLILYYKLLRKKVVFTAHNVNARKRDGTDSLFNRFSLRIQYRLVNHILVHTKKTKAELFADFGVNENKVTVIPFGINNTVPNTILSAAEAKRLLGISSDDKTLLCYGQIAPYKGLEYLAAAFAELLKRDRSYRLIIAGKPKWNQDYWNQIAQLITNSGVRHRVIERIEHVPDEETELYFKAADVLVLPYTQVFQSGVLFLGYSFGLPVIAADVGSLKEEIIEGKTGFVFKPRDSSDLASKIENYFTSELFRNLETRRAQIKKYANERYSWSKVASVTAVVYSDLLRSTEDRAQSR
jgi:D-inositol-3-phosphate glycosyltransferase